MIESASAQLSGAQKAAILMLSLGTENSSKVMALLGEGEVTQDADERGKNPAVFFPVERCNDSSVIHLLVSPLG